MIQPSELKLNLPMKISDGVISSTTSVWDILAASKNGDLEAVKKMVDSCPELIYAQYNYTPPVHFAVREGHTQLVKHFLDNGAHDPSYKTYPFLDSLSTMAKDRGHFMIEEMLNQYTSDLALCNYKGDNGEILLNMPDQQREFQGAVNHGELGKAKEILLQQPEFA